MLPRSEGRKTMAIATINPATGETVKTYDEMSEADVERRLAAAAAAHASYRLTGFDARAGWMRRAAGILDGEQDPDRGDDDD
jgi:succinate-semialdehyde dehydrogenase/glutarate-semialdehyde dehydrogenase